MHRRIAALAMAVLFLLAGCVKVDASFTIRDDTHMDMEFEFGILKSALTGDPSADVCVGKVQIPQGSTYTRVDDGTYVGCRVTGRVALDAMSGTDGPNLKKAGSVYVFTWSFVMPVETDSPPEEAAKVISSFHVAVTFPGPVVSHNGSSTVSGRTVTWTKPVDLYRYPGLEASGRTSNIEALILPMTIGGVLVAVLVAVGWYFIMRRKPEQSYGTMQTAYPQPPAPQQYGQPTYPQPPPGQFSRPGPTYRPDQPGGYSPPGGSSAY